MTMQNLDQIRAANALKAATQKMGGKNSGEVVKKVPPMIRENGILGALAFAKSDDSDDNGYRKCFVAIIEHLKSLGKTSSTDLDSFLSELTKADSAKLREVTSETMLYLNYLRRFAHKADKNGD